MTQDPRTTDEYQERRLNLAVQVRNFEIELFWKRSVFFWGFISSAFVGYATLHKLNSDLGLVIACFGMVCSCAWTLLNRGSKYWQESWEAKVELSELETIGKFFAKEEPIQSYKGRWLRARKYSVSKLAIALSDYVFFLWLALVVAELIERYAPVHAAVLKSYGLPAFVGSSLLYLPALLIFGRKSPSQKS